MKKNKINLKNLPEEIPIFPLSNAIFFPNTVLPLNIFEPRYKQMIADSLEKNKFIGMAQPNLQNLQSSKPDIFNVGCVGIVQKHNKTPEGTYLVNLEGLVRFKVIKELKTEKLYRTFKVSYLDFSSDLEENNKKEIDTKSTLELIEKTKKFFKMFQLSTDWRMIEKVEPNKLINSLAMICPFTSAEKQRLLETTSIRERNEILNQIINFYILGNTTDFHKKIH
jgi:Lon protease-like protein